MKPVAIEGYEHISIESLLDAVNADPRVYDGPPSGFEYLADDSKLIEPEEVEMPLPEERKPDKVVEIISPLEGWAVEIRDGGVKRTPRLITLSSLPEKPPGEFYATWIAEKDGMFWAPWIVWDVDDQDIQNALLRTQRLVATLESCGATSGTLRVVFSTSKGFHVYLDSRTAGVRPSAFLHSELRTFCGKLAETDRSLYDMHHAIGIPNSKHRKTGWYYSLIPLATLKQGWWPEIKMLTAKQQEIPSRLERVDALPALVKLLEPAKPEKRQYSSSHIQRVMSQPPPEFYGVGEGQRDLATLRLASYCKGLDMPEEFALVICREANSKNKPPLEDGVAKEKVWRVFNK